MRLHGLLITNQNLKVSLNSVTRRKYARERARKKEKVREERQNESKKES